MRRPRVRVTLRRIMVAIALVAVLVACHLWPFRPAFIRLELAPAPLRANTDHPTGQGVFSTPAAGRAWRPPDAWGAGPGG